MVRWTMMMNRMLSMMMKNQKIENCHDSDGNYKNNEK
jgi:hypothetical protein